MPVFVFSVPHFYLVICLKGKILLELGVAFVKFVNKVLCLFFYGWNDMLRKTFDQCPCDLGQNTFFLSQNFLKTSWNLSFFFKQCQAFYYENDCFKRFAVGPMKINTLEGLEGGYGQMFWFNFNYYWALLPRQKQWHWAQDQDYLHYQNAWTACLSN